MVLDKNSNETLSTIPMFFTNSSRILEIKSIKNGCCLFDSAQEMFKDFAKESYFGLNAEINSVGKLFLLTFSSYSQAKKTLDTLNKTVLAVINENNIRFNFIKRYSGLTPLEELYQKRGKIR